MVAIEVSKIDAALTQLDWAIRLMIDHSAYIPAVTLAGAAEEVLGKAVAEKASFGILKGLLAKMAGVPETKVSQDYLNRARNWLKHWNEHPADATILMEPDKEAVQYIARGISNAVALQGTLTPEMKRFVDWARSHRELILLRQTGKRASGSVRRPIRTAHTKRGDS